MKNQVTATSGQQIDQLIVALDSLKDGDLAAEKLIIVGRSAIPALSDFLLRGSPRSISLPRCRAVRALGQLGAYSTLISYFREYERPQDGSVLFTEDAVRSAAARELMRWRSDEVFHVLLDAAKQRATEGLIVALGEFHRPESVPVMFEVLEDDLCRECAMENLRNVPNGTRQYAFLAIRQLTGVNLDGAAAVCRRRAVLQLLSELGISPSDWPELRRFLSESDPAIVVAAAQVGLSVAPESEWPQIITALLKVADRLDSVQQGDVTQLLDAHRTIAHEIAFEIAQHRKDLGQKPNWLSPSWRILNQLLDRSLERHHSSAG
jgi:hypothetical protein